jgi:hypothetical protein
MPGVYLKLADWTTQCWLRMIWVTDAALSTIAGTI